MVHIQQVSPILCRPINCNGIYVQHQLGTCNLVLGIATGSLGCVCRDENVPTLRPIITRGFEDIN